MTKTPVKKPPRKLRATEIKHILSSWVILNKELSEIRHESEIEQLLHAEMHGKRRGQFLFRLHSRFNKLRANRERVDLLAIATDDMQSKIASYPELRRMVLDAI